MFLARTGKVCPSPISRLVTAVRRFAANVTGPPRMERAVGTSGSFSAPAPVLRTVAAPT